MHKFFAQQDHVEWAMQMLLIALYGASVAAFVVGLKWIRGALTSYFSGLFFLTLCPFFILFVAAVVRLAPIFYCVDTLSNAQELLSNAVAPLYLGLGTTLLLVLLYSLLYLRVVRFKTGL